MKRSTYYLGYGLFLCGLALAGYCGWLPVAALPLACFGNFNLGRWAEITR